MKLGVLGGVKFRQAADSFGSVYQRTVTSNNTHAECLFRMWFCLVAATYTVKRDGQCLSDLRYTQAKWHLYIKSATCAGKIDFHGKNATAHRRKLHLR